MHTAAQPWRRLSKDILFFRRRQSGISWESLRFQLFFLVSSAGEKCLVYRVLHRFIARWYAVRSRFINGRWYSNACNWIVYIIVIIGLMQNWIRQRGIQNANIKMCGRSAVFWQFLRRKKYRRSIRLNFLETFIMDIKPTIRDALKRLPYIIKTGTMNG